MPIVSAVAVVVVQVAPPESAHEHGNRLIAACTQGLRQGACLLAAGAPSEQHSAIIAQVTWEDEKFQVVAVRVGRPGAEQREWISGKLVFDEDDALPDRWTTTGFTVATLVGDLATGDAEPSSRPDAPAAEPPVSAPAPPANEDRPPAPATAAGPDAEAARRRFQLSAGVLFGQAMEDQGLRTGPWASLSHAPLPLPLAWRVRGAMSFAEAQDVSLRWYSVTAGLELDLPLGRSGVSAVAAVEGGASLVSASAGSDASRLSGLLLLNLGVEVPISGPLRGLVGGELSLGPATNVQKGQETGEIIDRKAKTAGLVGLGWEL